MKISNITSLTAIESKSLDLPANLADGHAKLDPVVNYFAEPQLAALAEARQSDLEGAFISAFRSSCSEDFDPDGSIFFPSASLAIDAVAKFLASTRRLRVGLIEPTFDNIALIARRAGLLLEPIREDFSAIVRATSQCDALFLVVPNNPTGWTLQAGELLRVAEAALANECLLILDRTFKFFEDSASWETGSTEQLASDWIVIEDTGKTWSTLECKVAFTRCGSVDTRKALREIAEEITLNVSPVSLHLTARAIELEGGASRIRSAVHRNRQTLVNELSGLRVKVKPSSLSVALVALPQSLAIDDVELVGEFAKFGVGVLPGSQFFWASHPSSTGLIRLALARNPTHFSSIIPRVRNAFEGLV